MSRRYAIVPYSLLKHPKITSADIAVYASIASYANKKGVAYPSIPRIANESKKKPRWVSERIKHMESTGFIQVKRSRGKHNYYQLIQHPIGGFE